MRVEEEKKKESWMDKLIELLSKAKPLAPWFWWDIRNDGAMIISKEEKNNWHSWEICFVKKEELCWKEYWFIKWLVENYKIDLDKAMKLWIPCFVQYDKWEIISVHDVDFYKQLLMLLSIQDNPIEFLISILK